MKLVTVATHSEAYFPYLKKSCERNGYDLVILGWDQKWTGYSFKLKLIQSYLQDLPDDEVVCFIDSFDVIALRPLQELEKSFLDFSKNTGARVVVGYDRAASTVIKGVGSLYFGTVYGYLVNSGTYMGYNKDIKRMINEIYTDPKEDDQKVLTEYCKKNPNDVYIDSASLFFLTINNPFGDNFYDPVLMKIQDGHLWYRGIKPFFAHGNGNTDMNRVIELLGYPMTDAEKKQITLFNRKSKLKKTKWYVNDVMEHSTLPWLVFLAFALFLLLVKLKIQSSN
jgi:hypothetical protein